MKKNISIKKIITYASILLMTLFLFSSTSVIFGKDYDDYAKDDYEKKDDYQKSDSGDTSDQKEEEVETSVDVDISDSMQTTIIGDRDRDGLLDNEDPHPDIVEAYIVSDDNRNGIVDKFERLQLTKK